MNDYTVQQRIKTTTNNALRTYNYKRAITMALKNMGIEEEFNTMCYLALAVTLENKNAVWDDDLVRTALDEHDDSSEKSLIKVTNALRKAGVLRNGKRNGHRVQELTVPFKKVSGEFIADHINTLPVQMLPLEDVPMWEHGVKNDLRISMISRVPKKVIKQQPQNVLNAMNKLQNTPFTVNPVLVQYLKYRLAEVVNKNTNAATDIGRTEITNLNNQIKHLTVLSEEQKFIKFLITADFRGRIYYRGGILTPQGHDFQKAAFQFARARKLGKLGKVALAIQFANVYGLDKKSIAEKILWISEEGTDLAYEITNNGYLPKEADKLYQTIVAAYEWKRLMDWEDKGKDASKFKSHLVCHQDGTCNGLQHGAALRKDRKTAIAVNCTASTWEDTPRDIYQDGVDIMITEMRKKGANEQADLIEMKGRNAMKWAVMVTGYGAGLTTAMKTCLEQFTPEQQAILCQGDALEYSIEIALNHVAGALIHTHKILMKAIGNKMKKGVVPIQWRTADGFLVFQASRATDNDAKEYKGAGDFVYRIDEINEGKQASAITANFIHSMDGTHMRMTTNAFDYELVTVHDSYGSHAGTYHELSTIIREQFVEMHKYDQLASFNKLNKMNVQLTDMGDYDPAEVLESEYFFS